MMKNIKIDVPSIARLGSLLVALINQSLAIFGKDALPFTENMAYQIVSLVATVVIVLINAWFNNDITKAARIAGGVLKALKDGKLSEEEIAAVLDSVEEESPEADNGNAVIKFVNKIIEAIKAKIKKK